MAEAEKNQPETVPEVISDLIDMVKQYATQETVDPLKSLGRFFKLGFPGALLAAFGAVLLVLALLRALQVETGSTFTGHWSWVPYLITFIGAALVIGLAVYRANKRGNPT